MREEKKEKEEKEKKKGEKRKKKKREGDLVWKCGGSDSVWISDEVWGI